MFSVIIAYFMLNSITQLSRGEHEACTRGTQNYFEIRNRKKLVSVCYAFVMSSSDQRDFS